MEPRSDWLLEPGQVIDRFVVEAPLGRGACAEVYRVRHAQLGQRHALKLLTLASATLRERMVREGQVQATLGHPNVVTVQDVFEVGGRPALLMEYVDGPTLETWLEQARPGLLQADALAHGIIAGVAAAHARGVLHRDLKPANVLLARVGDRLTPKVADFGLARVMDESDAARLTHAGDGLGTPAYLAPEQANEAHQVDARADVFSLGAILYELCCGQRAFPGQKITSILTRSATGNYQPPRDLCPTLPEAWERAIVGALEPDFELRIPDCATLLQVWDAGSDTPQAAASAGAPRIPPASQAPTDTLHAVQAALGISPGSRPGASWPGPPPAVPAPPIPASSTPTLTPPASQPELSKGSADFGGSKLLLWGVVALAAVAGLACGGALLFWLDAQRQPTTAPIVEAPPPLPGDEPEVIVVAEPPPPTPPEPPKPKPRPVTQPAEPAAPAPAPAPAPAGVPVRMLADPREGTVSVEGHRVTIGDKVSLSEGEHTFRYAGGAWSITCDVRITASTTRVKFTESSRSCVAYE
ncbi:MAG: serine/threonine-protein kinase [Pseudomonadota bacterium]